ncbi:hypothetical protein DID88_000416 [Monilinia fructigena]|uniref:Uncharacterized protein n=1 Tax=Monilinia fructigena TaxID=38457 RepID=A0A395IHG4_9HELO|nr:hypothetical protein DID88_000416 [Monilinia fructigena]
MKENGGNYDQWDRESGVLGGQAGVRGNASSNGLGQHFGEEIITDSSSTTRRLRNEDSTSTLKSHYDRQKLPAAISQQTSASSARDLALRKGLSPVVQRSPHSQIDSMDPWDQAGQNFSSMNDNRLGSPDRRKSVRVGLSSLFHRSERRPSAGSHNSYDSSKQPGSVRNRLGKAASKESLKSQRASILSSKPRDHRDQVQDQTNDGSSYNSYDHYEASIRNSHMRSIPESNVSEVFNLFPATSEKNNGRQPGSLDSEKREGHRRLEDLHSRPGEKDACSWKNVRSNNNGHFRNSMISQSTGHSSLGISSTGSISSHNTKTSRQTGGSVFSSADLQQSSVLSLSSDSEEDLSDAEPSKSRDNMSIGKAPSHAESEIIPPALQHRLSTKGSTRRSSGSKNPSSSRKGAAQSSAFLTIPESTGGLSEWPMPPTITRQNSVKSQESRPASSHEKSSISSKKSIQQQPTPPLSPKEVDAETASICTTSSGRMMQVTKQEEALLEALRQKRARMREKILEEHKAKENGSQSPPRSATKRASSRFSKASSIDTLRSGTERVPLYLDAPIMEARKLRYGNRHGNATEHGQKKEHRQPSPNLSGFLNFGTGSEDDDDETPTNSRGVSRDDVRDNNGFEVPHLPQPGTPPQVDPRFSSLGKGREKKGSAGKAGHIKRNPSVGKVRFSGRRKMRRRFGDCDSELGIVIYIILLSLL